MAGCRGALAVRAVASALCAATGAARPATMPLVTPPTNCRREADVLSISVMFSIPWSGTVIRTPDAARPSGCRKHDVILARANLVPVPMSTERLCKEERKKPYELCPISSAAYAAATCVCVQGVLGRHTLGWRSAAPGTLHSFCEAHVTKLLNNTAPLAHRRPDESRCSILLGSAPDSLEQEQGLRNFRLACLCRCWHRR